MFSESGVGHQGLLVDLRCQKSLCTQACLDLHIPYRQILGTLYVAFPTSSPCTSPPRFTATFREPMVERPLGPFSKSFFGSASALSTQRSTSCCKRFQPPLSLPPFSTNSAKISQRVNSSKFGFVPRVFLSLEVVGKVREEHRPSWDRFVCYPTDEALSW